ncbi:MAG: AbrB/MazE/SpoVT family DNA-binding domain-containing protein [Methanoregula sp.]
MEASIIRMSSKGQIVIPASMRKGLKEGEELLIVRDGERYLIKPLGGFEAALKEDIEFAEKTEQSLAEYRKGLFKVKEKQEFINELASW